MTTISHPFSPRLWLRLLRGRPRLWWSVAVGIVTFLLIPESMAHHVETRMLLGWNAGTLLYLSLAAIMVHRSDIERIQHRALVQHEGRFLVLTMAILASLAVLLAIGSQLSLAKDMKGLDQSLHVGLAAVTVMTAWLFMQMLFAQHYAHEYYVTRLRHKRDVLAFPGTAEPDYGDFLYFACVIGTSGQTADVAFTDSRLRRVGALHCVLAFLFNTTMLALTINVAASLF